MVLIVSQEASGRAEAILVEGDVEFDERDAILLRSIDETGSVAAAAENLGRSRARALRRLETLEGAFGPLVERHRGGSDGGGSRLTGTGVALLERYDRLAAALQAAATVPETVLRGSVTAVDGELATIETSVGGVRALHDGVEIGDDVQVRIGADAVTLHTPEETPPLEATSARNRVTGTVAALEERTTVVDVEIAVSEEPERSGDSFSRNPDDPADARFHALVTDESRSRLAIEPGDDVVVTWKATATRVLLARFARPE